MSKFNESVSGKVLLRELVVPVLMIAVIGLFLYDSMHLSREALIFPGVLIATVIGLLAWTVVAHATGPAPTAQVADDEDDEAGPIMVAKPWLLVLLPAILVAGFDMLGVLAALLILVIGGQAIFGIRSWMQSTLIALASVVPTYLIFKYVLYARFPGGVFGF